MIMVAPCLLPHLPAALHMNTHRSPDIHDNTVLLWCLHGEAGNVEEGGVLLCFWVCSPQQAHSLRRCISVCEMEEMGSWGLCFGGGGLLSGDPKVRAVGPSQAGVRANFTPSTPVCDTSPFPNLNSNQLFLIKKWNKILPWKLCSLASLFLKF